MEEFDFDLIEKILLEQNDKRKIISADLYLSGDEFWNTTTIIEKGKFIRKKWFVCFGGSYWATPMLRIKVLIGSDIFEKTFDVSKEVEDEKFNSNCVEEWLQKTEIYKKLGLDLVVEDE